MRGSEDGKDSRSVYVADEFARLTALILCPAAAIGDRHESESAKRRDRGCLRGGSDIRPTARCIMTERCALIGIACSLGERPFC